MGLIGFMSRVEAGFQPQIMDLVGSMALMKGSTCRLIHRRPWEEEGDLGGTEVITLQLIASTNSCAPFYYVFSF